jgi:tellurite resistance protein TerC
MNPFVLWGLFGVVLLGMLALDLGVFNRRSHAIRPREAVLSSAVWIGVSLAFNVVVFVALGQERGLEFLAGYLIEKSLSVDNIFVFVLIFSYFKVASQFQHKVLFWGVIGAIVMRGVLIAIGAVLIQQFDWILYVFGAFLIYTAYKLATQKEEGVHPDQNPVVTLFRRLMPVSSADASGKFFTRSGGRWMATPLFIVLLVVETTDLVFAFDSIPAIFAVTTDPFVVFTSNMFAILGLRALYFLLASVVGTFRYLKRGLAVVLAFVGAKMLVDAVDIHIPIVVSLGVIALILTVAIGASLVATRREGRLALSEDTES